MACGRAFDRPTGTHARHLADAARGWPSVLEHLRRGACKRARGMPATRAARTLQQTARAGSGTGHAHEDCATSSVTPRRRWPSATAIRLPEPAADAGPCDDAPSVRCRSGQRAYACARAGTAFQNLHASAELDQRPQIMVHVQPEFPPNVSAQGGRVVLRLYIGDDGTVDEVAVRSSSRPAYSRPRRSARSPRRSSRGRQRRRGGGELLVDRGIFRSTGPRFPQLEVELPTKSAARVPNSRGRPANQ